ncbi:MAG TPA: hypothetical protein VGO04_09555 [Ensifer sp.]|jgi:hypothetical protein|uniref:hypothetical protein n=1 Tax=Ensifer sp. TaxID=1872086 RepID=UPI002E1192D5|nr:hypothetical protein [Ensifer sp.]
MATVDTTNSAASAYLAPASNTSQSEPANKGAGRQAWLREMERAQTSGWFQPFQESSLADRGANSNGTAGDSAMARPVAPMRSPMAFARLPQQDAGTETAAFESADRQRELAQPDAAPSSPAPASQAMAETGGQGGEDSLQAASDSDAAHEFGIGQFDPAAPMTDKGSEATPQGVVLNTHMGLSKGNGSQASDANSLLRRQAVAPFMPAIAQAATAATELSLLSAREIAKTDATAVSKSRTDDVDGPLSSANLAKAILSGHSSTRLHTAWTQEGLNLWLGMDGSAVQVSAQASMIVSTLQQTLRSHGQRLNRVVCNGSVVFDASIPSVATNGDFFAELERHASGWPSAQSSSSRSFLSQKETS